MHFYHRRPSPALAHLVELFWTWEAVEMPHGMERLLPNGAISLIINLREDETRSYVGDDLAICRRQPGAVMVGAHSRYMVIDTREQLSVAGVQFHPGGAFPFLGLPAGELADRIVPLEALWRNWANELRERLLEAESPDRRLDILEDAVAARAVRVACHPAVSFALREFRGRARSVSDVTDQLGLSSRRFLDVFRDQVGMPPKRYCRVQRFQQVLRHIRSGRPIDWADLALSAGYFDQAHFIHDFRAFSGISPSTYAREDLRHGNHVPIHD